MTRTATYILGVVSGVILSCLIIWTLSEGITINSDKPLSLFPDATPYQDTTFTYIIK